VFLAFFIVIIIQVASNWAFAPRLATHSMACCVATTAIVAFLALFSSLSLHFAILCSFLVALSIAFFL
jgi:hypothetical protein